LRRHYFFSVLSFAGKEKKNKKTKKQSAMVKYLQASRWFVLFVATTIQLPAFEDMFQPPQNMVNKQLDAGL
jgi:hypothetical protein